MPEQIPYLRIFLSSPGDVNEERKIAIEVIEALPYRPAFRDKVAFRVIAWDRPGADTPMLASLTPQEAINRGLPKPSECDITLVLFWKRMGTPFVDVDGTAYESGTHWELMDALKNPHCETLIFHRTEKVLFDVDDAVGLDQYRRVRAFFNSDVFYKDGRILRGVNHYVTPEDFRQKMQTFMEDVVLRILEKIKKKPLISELLLPADTPNIVTVEKADWPQGKSPFPGLRAFTPEDAAIFFGRGYETDQLTRQVANSRFVTVVGASGSGKSSLVGAGLIPRLAANAISDEHTGSRDWRIVRFTPGKNPFESLFEALVGVFPQFKPNALEARHIKQNFIADMREAPETLVGICEVALEGAPTWAEVLLFVDQFEELFTLSTPEDARLFSMMLKALSAHPRLRAVLTLRHDFFNKAVEDQILSEMLRAAAVFSLAIPRRDALREMIERPAERAELTLERGLVERILDDVGDEPGNLALMAYALDELYKIAEMRHDQRITFEDYKTLAGVQGAIGVRAHNIFKELDENTQKLFLKSFRHLINIASDGTPTRKRALLSLFQSDEKLGKVIEKFVSARLLVVEVENDTKAPTIEVAHEALFHAWQHLAAWIHYAQRDIQVIQEMKRAAQLWERNHYSDAYRWSHERLQDVYRSLSIHGVEVKTELTKVEVAFLEPEQKRLLREIEKIETDHKRRRWIGERLAVIGDPRSGTGLDERGLPQIDWLPVSPGGEISIESKIFTVQPLYVAKYLVTHRQFQAFLNAPDGFEDERWWQDFPEEYMKQAMTPAVAQYDNYPRDSVSWYQAVAFTRWLDAKHREHYLFDNLPLGEWQIRLPTEWEWHWMAQNGREDRKYPWGQWDGYPRANTREAGVGDHSTSVGMYLHGAAACGALDVAGNLWEWCLNDYENPAIITPLTNRRHKALRGGSFSFSQDNAAASYRSRNNPDYGSDDFGVRLVFSDPISVL